MLKIAANRKYQSAPRGEKSGRSKLTEWKVKMIRSFSKMPESLAESLGQSAGISTRYVYQLREKNPKRWKHILKSEPTEKKNG